jgi:hypothetical protein
MKRESEIKKIMSAQEMNIDRSSSSSSSLSTHKSVRFGECAVRSYSQVLGDHPYCSKGCPLQLGWEYESLESLTIDDYETSRRGGQLHPRSLRMTWEERRTILREYSDGELRRACRRSNRNCGQRRVQKEFFVAISE